MPASIVAGEARQLAHFLEISPGDLPEEETECEIPEGVQFVRGGFVRCPCGPEFRTAANGLQQQHAPGPAAGPGAGRLGESESAGQPRRASHRVGRRSGPAL